MTVLVVGSAGHLGEAIVRTLRAGGHAARGLDLKPSLATDVVGSVCDRDVVREAMRGVAAVINTAALHKPHLVTHTPQHFVDVNITGVLNLLEEAVLAKVEAFVQTSTTSAFGGALAPPQGQPAAWITEDVVAIPKNVYGATKLAAEHLCRVFARTQGLPVVILRTARFFPEEDDNVEIRSGYGLLNVHALELLYRRADIADVVSAHLAAVESAREIQCGMYIVSATTPFTRADLALLGRDAASAILQKYPGAEALFNAAGWRFFPTFDRVYVNMEARRSLNWRPRYDFEHVLECIAAGEEFRSELALEVGSKGYHATKFEDGPYPV